MARIFITGSSDGLGLAAARRLLDQQHEVVLHARNDRRADDTRRAIGRDVAVVVGDLARDDETREVAGQVNALGRFDAVIHNAGIGYREPRRIETIDGHAHLLAINVLAPYVLTTLITPPRRLITLSSGMHRMGVPSVQDLDWTARRWDGVQAYADSKLFDATLSAAVARLWPDVLSNALEPGWVPTKMGGPGAPDDLGQAHLTQTWLATSTEPAALTNGRYFYHRATQQPHPAVNDRSFQTELLNALADKTGLTLRPRSDADEGAAI